MTAPLRLAVAGVGNNISALYQGTRFYEQRAANGAGQEPAPGILRDRLGGIGVSDIEFVAAFDVDDRKVGRPLGTAAIEEPNNYPVLVSDPRPSDVEIEFGVTEDDLAGGRKRVAETLREAGAEVLLYSLPTGLSALAETYALAAADAEVAFVNCTPERVARSQEIAESYEKAGIPLVGDDLASHLGSSVVHGALLSLLARRGLTLLNSYQLNFGGNADFANLRDHGESKRESKVNALAGTSAAGKVDVIPSAGFIAHLEDHKVAIINIEAQGWAGTPVSLDLKLTVQDSSNAAGVIIDLVRIAGAARRAGERGFPAAAASLLKSPPAGRDKYSEQDAEESLRRIEPS